MALEHLGNGDDGFEPATHCASIPTLEEVERGARLSALPEVERLLFECPSPAHLQILAEQIAQLGSAFRVEVLRREEKKKFAPCKGRFSLALKLSVLVAPHVVDRFVETFGDMKTVMNGLGVRHLGFGHRKESRAHVYDDGFDFLALIGGDALEKPLGASTFPALGDLQNARTFRITQYRNVTLSARKVFLINAHGIELFQRTTLQTSFHGRRSMIRWA